MSVSDSTPSAAFLHSSPVIMAVGLPLGLAAVKYLPPMLTVIYAHEALAPLGRQKMNSKPITDLPVPKP